MSKPLQLYLRLLGGLTILSCAGQLAFPVELGVQSAWGVAPGWQREIAFWNLAMYVVIAGTLRAGEKGCGRRVAMALVLLQILVATNHAAATIQHPAMLNAVMCGINYGCAAFGVFALWHDRKSSPGS